jgi:hypothetical protein
VVLSRPSSVRSAAAPAAVAVLLAACTSLDAASPVGGAAARTPATTSPTPAGTSGRPESLQCSPGDQVSSMVADYGSDAAGHPTPLSAARVLADDSDLPRTGLVERLTSAGPGAPVVEYRSEDGRLLAYVLLVRGPQDGWLGGGIGACQEAYRR